jgi:hypothetical protein
MLCGDSKGKNGNLGLIPYFFWDRNLFGSFSKHGEGARSAQEQAVFIAGK